MCLRCDFDGEVLRAGNLERWSDFSTFESELKEQGPWIAGIDFPFGQASKFIERIGWPRDWLGYVRHADSLGRDGFRKALDTFREGQVEGDKEHRRETDVAAGSISPQKLYGVPVGLMFFEGAPRLVRSEVTIPHLQVGEPDRIVVEAYPGVLARKLVGRRSYKHEEKKKQTPGRLGARQDILRGLTRWLPSGLYGFRIDAPVSLCDDPAGDDLDALLCAVQAAWAWRNRLNRFGAPSNVNPDEGWIADPSLARSASAFVSVL
jgi:Protein of unknown function (DUF429)